MTDRPQGRPTADGDVTKTFSCRCCGEAINVTANLRPTGFSAPAGVRCPACGADHCVETWRTEDRGSWDFGLFEPES